MSNKTHPRFELLILDTKGESVIKSEVNLVHSLCSNGTLWADDSPQPIDSGITAGKTEIEIRQIRDDEEIDGNSLYFIIDVKAEFGWLEPRRTVLLEYLKKQNFDSRFVLTDEISEEIANELYPLIYNVENLLRAYIVKFMTTRLGTKWWEDTATSEILKKVNQRKNNDRVFGDLIDNRAHLIDFGELGQIIFSHSTGFTSKDDILRRINEVEETPEAIRAFKEELKSNYQKFFKESFSDKNFQEKWEYLEKIRHKVAHNGLFSNEERIEGIKEANDLIEIIKAALQGVDTVKLRQDEKEAIRESFSSQGYFDDITEDGFLEELANSEEYFAKRSDGFVGLSSMVNYLRSQGYDPYTTKKLIKQLEFDRKIEVYHQPNIYDADNPVAALKRIRPSTPTLPKE